MRSRGKGLMKLSNGLLSSLYISSH